MRFFFFTDWKSFKIIRGNLEGNVFLFIVNESLIRNIILYFVEYI